MSESTTLQEWLAAMIDASTELATVTLGFDGVTTVGTADDVADHSAGAYIGLVGETTTVQLAMCSTIDGCKQLARALLGMTEEDELADSDMADAMGEVMNIVAGTVKTRMDGRLPALKLGLPLFVTGRVYSVNQPETAVLNVDVGPIRAQLVAFRPRGTT